MRVAVAMSTHCCLNILTVHCRIHIVLKQILSQMLVSSVAKKKTTTKVCKYFQYIPVHMINQVLYLKRGKPKVLINEVVQSFKTVYNTNSARGPFQVINLKYKCIHKYYPVLLLHNFVEPDKTMIKVVFFLIKLLYTLPTLILF